MNSTPEPGLLEKFWTFINTPPDKAKALISLVNMGWDLCLVVILIGFLVKMIGVKEGQKLIGIGSIGALIIFAIRIAYGI